jgi:hypothetical protein
VWNGWMGIPSDYVESNRFDGDYHNFIDKGVDNLHPGPFHNKLYSNKLIKHIIKNFPEFIPDGISNQDIKIYQTKLF